MARVRQLSVWLHGDEVAVLRRTGAGGVSCQYAQTTVDTFPLGAPLLSCSLPVRGGRQNAWAFVTGLLPEGQHRLSMSRVAGVETLDALGMLSRFGRDVAGALIIAPAAATAPGPHGGVTPGLVELSADDLVAEVAALPVRSLALHDDSELSLAGLEDKILLVRTASGWARPVHGYPSTHILKVDNRVHRGTVVAEHDCLQLARRAGLAAPDCHLMRIGDADCIVVERYDRVAVDGITRRIHQEDSCQALAIDPADHDGRGKYESHGGPTLAGIAGLLNAYSVEPATELTRLLERVTFTVVIDDADAHGKNISLLHPNAEHITLAPLYDTVPTSLWPTVSGKAAMRVNGRSRLAEITPEDLTDEARRWGLNTRLARQTITDTCERLRVASADMPERPGVDLPSLVVANLSRLARR